MSNESSQSYYSSYNGSYAGYYGDTYSYSNYTSYNDGIFYQHISFFDTAGLYDREINEVKGSYAETLNQYTRSYSAGVYTYDVQHTTTPLDGVYQSYGDRETTTYNANYTTASNEYVSFNAQQSYSIFSSYDYATGASVTAYDSRSFYSSGFYEYNHSFYSGSNGYSNVAYGSYHYTT